MDDFEKACENALLVQEELLTSILQKNSNCEYLQKHGSPSSLASFRAQVPIISYQDIAADIQKLADGSTRPILCTDPITHFAIRSLNLRFCLCNFVTISSVSVILSSSGTSSGKHKIIPQTRGWHLGDRMRAMKSFNAYLDKSFPTENPNPIALSFVYSGEQYKTKSGLLVGAVSSNYCRSEQFKQDSRNQTSPYQVVLAGSDWRQTTYCHLLCGLLLRNKVEYITAVFAYTLCEALRLLQREWKDLTEDISTGCLNSKITNEELRITINNLLKECSSKALAEEISSICSNESWNGVIPLLWPRAKYVRTAVSGAMQAYIPALRNYAGNLPLVGNPYGSTEGFYAINIQPSPPEDVSFTIIPYSVFYEFIPISSASSDEESIVGVGQVEVGTQYELVVTTAEGLYRYRVEDVVKVVGFHHQSPQIAFSYRKNAVLSINVEKVDEEELQKAVLSSVSTDEHVEVANFTSYADFITDEPAHYVIYWELKRSDGYPKHEVLKQCCDKLDKSFNVDYLIGRVNHTIGPLELVTVKQGTFEKLMEIAVANGASPGQYKTARCISSPTMLELVI